MTNNTTIDTLNKAAMVKQIVNFVFSRIREVSNSTDSIGFRIVEESEYDDSSDSYYTVSILEAYDVEDGEVKPTEPTNRWNVTDDMWFIEHLNEVEFDNSNIVSIYIGLLEKLEDINTVIRAIMWEKESAN